MGTNGMIFLLRTWQAAHCSGDPWVVVWFAAVFASAHGDILLFLYFFSSEEISWEARHWTKLEDLPGWKTQNGAQINYGMVM